MSYGPTWVEAPSWLCEIDVAMSESSEDLGSSVGVQVRLVIAGFPGFEERDDAVFAGIFTALVLSHREEINHAHPETATDVAWRLMFAALAQQMMFDDQEVSGKPMTIPALVHEITCCIVAYLKAPPAQH